MPGQEVPPNVTAGKAIGIYFGLTERFRQFIDQYSIPSSTDKVTSFANRARGFRLRVKFDETQFKQ